MTIREAIKSLGACPDNVYSYEVLLKTLSDDVVPIGYRYVYPLERYMGLGKGSYYTNSTSIVYPHVRLIIAAKKSNFSDEWLLGLEEK